jgi:hypothetical protein
LSLATAILAMTLEPVAAINSPGENVGEVAVQ